MKKLTKLAVLFALVFSVSACTFVAGNGFYNGEGKHVMHGKNYHGKMFADLKGKTSSQVKEELGNPSSETKSMLTYKKSDLKKPPHDGKGRKPHKGKKTPKHLENSLVKVYLSKDKVTKVEHVVVFD